MLTTFKYGCPSWYEANPELEEQFRLAHDLRNQLVEIHKSYEADVAKAWEQHPAVGASVAAVAAAETDVAALHERAAKERSEDRTTEPRPTTRAALKEARVVLRDAKAARRAAKDAGWSDVTAAIGEAGAARKAAVKGAYADFVQTRGLHWATYNDVVDHWKTSVAQVAAARKAGKPAELRFHRWDGSSTIAVQLQREAGKPPRTPGLLASGEGPWRNVLQVRPWEDPAAWSTRPLAERRRLARGTATMNLGGGRAADVPVVVHRMLPADADVVLARLTRRRVAGSYRYHVTLAARVAEPGPAHGDGVAVHLSWHGAGKGWIRVATIASAVDPLPPVPSGLEGLVRRGNDHYAEVFYPPEWAEALRRVDAVRADRDTLLEELRPRVVAALTKDHALAGQLDLAGSTVARWRAAGRFAALARRWPEADPLAPVLETWRATDRRLWEREAHTRDQITARRRDAWRKVAAWACGAALVVTVSAAGMADLREAAEAGEEDTWEARGGRKHIQRAAPGDLRAAVLLAARSRGVTVVEAAETRGG